MNLRLIDISLPITSRLPRWPGDPPIQMETFLDFPDDGVRASSLSFSLHTGTHIDAPLHHLPDGGDVDGLDLASLIGPVAVIDVGDVERVTAGVLGDHLGAEAPDRLLVKTLNSAGWSSATEFNPDFVAFTRDAAEWIVERGIRLVGVDYLSVQSFHDPDPDVHVILLEEGVVILEGLDLSRVDVALRHELLCLPLRIRGAEGGPCRAVLREIP
jgi:arylformamidase